MELYTDEARKQRPGDARRYRPFHRPPNVYVNIFQGAVLGNIKQGKKG